MKTEKEKQGLLKKRIWFWPLLILVFSSCALRSQPQPKQVRWQIVELAKNLAGIPYRFGGVDIDGFDCSGLVFYVYGCFGISVPRSAREQAGMNGAITLNHAVAGDILVYKFRRIWHSAVYLGDGRFIHAPSSGGWVRIDELNGYWLSHLRKVITVWTRAR